MGSYFDFEEFTRDETEDLQAPNKASESCPQAFSTIST